MTEITFYPVAAVSELADTGQLHVDLNGEEILLCTDGDQFFAVSYYCSHEALTLEGGSIQAGCITCPYHGAEFDLRTGEVRAPPAWENLKTYPVQVADDVVSIGV